MERTACAVLRQAYFCPQRGKRWKATAPSEGQSFSCPLQRTDQWRKITQSRELGTKMQHFPGSITYQIAYIVGWLCVHEINWTYHNKKYEEKHIKKDRQSEGNETTRYKSRLHILPSFILKHTCWLRQSYLLGLMFESMDMNWYWAIRLHPTHLII